MSTSGSSFSSDVSTIVNNIKKTCLDFGGQHKTTITAFKRRLETSISSYKILKAYYDGVLPSSLKAAIIDSKSNVKLFQDIGYFSGVNRVKSTWTRQ